MDPTPSQHDARYKLSLFADIIHQTINRRPKLIAVERETARALGIPDDASSAKVYGIEVLVIALQGKKKKVCEEFVRLMRDRREDDVCQTCHSFGLPAPCPACGRITKDE